eukprot:scaffold77238_cov60-Phaeocystis_antarctica.AAC.1
MGKCTSQKAAGIHDASTASNTTPSTPNTTKAPPHHTRVLQISLCIPSRTSFPSERYACCRAVRPSSSTSSVLALARSSSCTHASCPWHAAHIRAVLPELDCRSGLAECCRRTSRMERWPWYAASTSAVVPRLVWKSTLAPCFSSTLTISRWPLAAAACSRAAVGPRSPTSVGKEPTASAPPLRSHLTTRCSSPRCADRMISMGRAAGDLIAARGRAGEIWARRVRTRACSRSWSHSPSSWGPRCESDDQTPCNEGWGGCLA